MRPWPWTLLLAWAARCEVQAAQILREYDTLVGLGAAAHSSCGLRSGSADTDRRLVRSRGMDMLVDDRLNDQLKIPISEYFRF